MRRGAHTDSSEYARLIDHGFFDEDDPIELLDGLLLVKEPQHSPHRTAILLVAKALGADATVAPLAARAAVIRVADLLP